VSGSRSPSRSTVAVAARCSSRPSASALPRTGRSGFSAARPMLLKDRLAVLDVQVVGQARALTTLSAICSGGGGLIGGLDRPSGEVVWPDALMLVASRFASVYRSEAGGWGRRFFCRRLVGRRWVRGRAAPSGAACRRRSHLGSRRPYQRGGRTDWAGRPHGRRSGPAARSAGPSGSGMIAVSRRGWALRDTPSLARAQSSEQQHGELG
jgi:hypothetical protein